MNTKIFLHVAAVCAIWGVIAVSAPGSVVTGFVFIDADMNAEWDYRNERVLPGVTIRIEETSGSNFTAETVTDEYGRFAFDDLTAGVYDVTQVQLLPQYISVTVDIGTLVDLASSMPLATGYGVARQYSQSRGIMPGILSITIPNESTGGYMYNFGQIWWGKFMYLGEPPGHPPGSKDPPPQEIIPEPSAVALLLVGAICMLMRRRS